MKTKIILVIALVANTAISIAQNIPSYVPKNGLVGWWPFNGNANDESGNGNNGSVNGATLTTDRDGNANSAYSFDGVNNQINVPSSSSVSNFSNGQTISFWAKISAYPTDGKEHYIIAKNDNSGTPNVKFYEIMISDFYNVDNIIYRYATSSTITSQGSSLPFTQIPLNQWFHLCFTTDLTNAKAYLNGVLYKTYTMYSPIGLTNNNLVFGNTVAVNSTNAPFNGELDDILIYNRVLNSDEVSLLYKKCSKPTATITPKSKTTFCQGSSVELEANSGTNYTYQWFKGSQLINNATNAIYKATTTGNYAVKVIDGACSDTSDIASVVVNTNPSVSINSIGSIVYKSGNTIQLQGNPSGGTFTGMGITGSILNPAEITLGKKSITYDYTTPEGCSGTSTRTYTMVDTLGNVCSTYDTLKINFKLTTGIKVNELTSVSAYPNPTSDVLTIHATDFAAMSGYAYKIVDIQGKELYNKVVEKAITQVSLNTLGAKGVYILHIIDGNGTSIENKKIVLQ